MRNQPIELLLIDDDDINNFLSREIINTHMPQAQIKSFTKAELALEYIQARIKIERPLPDIILLDINMPLMDGWEFLRACEKLDLEKFRNTNIFLCTSSVYHEDKLKAQNFKLVKKFYVKPVTEQDLDEMIGINA